MKALKILTHPYTLIISFLAIMISGEHLGGFYVLYLLLGLPFGAIHSLLALAGICSLLLGYHKYHRNNIHLAESIFKVIGTLLLFLSIYLFFLNDKEHYNYGTFYQTVPVITLVFFSFLSVCFLLAAIIKAVKLKAGESNLLVP